MNFSIDDYRKHGYVILRNIINKKLLISLRKNINKVFYKSSKYKKKNFHKDLLQFRKIKKKNFGYFFDTIQTLSINYQILTQSKILSTTNKLLKNSKNCISLTDIALRIDPPIDNRNSLKWHQDSSYFRQNNNGFNGLVVWLPVFDVDKKTGTISFLEQSHTIGPQNIKRRKIRKNFSSQRNIDERLLKDFREVEPTSIKPGDAIVMNMDMVHKSSNNFSKKNRISLIGRYHNTISGDFNSGLNIFRYSNKNFDKEVHGN